MVDQFRLSTFSGRVGESFQLIASPTMHMELLLAQADALGAQTESPESTRGPFSLIFHGPLSPVLPQATYRFEHAELREFDIFIVPIGPQGDKMRYEAIFT